MKLSIPACGDQVAIIKQQFDELDLAMPYKLTTSKRATRFNNEEDAVSAFRGHAGNALLTYNAPGKQQKVLKYKYR